MMVTEPPSATESTASLSTLGPERMFRPPPSSVCTVAIAPATNDGVSKPRFPAEAVLEVDALEEVVVPAEVRNPANPYPWNEPSVIRY